MEQDLRSCTQGEVGNTETTSKRSRGWCFTLNNYTEEEYENIKSNLHSNTIKYIIGKEVGENGTPHLQGYCYYKEGKTFKYMKTINERIHWERARGNPSQNYEYCSKQNVAACNGFEKKQTQQDIIKQEMLTEYENIEWKQWQQEVLDIIAEGGDDRKINWIVDIEGNKGKSLLARYLCIKENCILADGKKDNIFNAFKVACVDENKRINLCIMDIPRSNEKFTNYGVIEKILDRIIYSGKYEGGQILLPKMTVIVFSNFVPKKEEMTSDRWNIIVI